MEFVARHAMGLVALASVDVRVATLAVVALLGEPLVVAAAVVVVVLVVAVVVVAPVAPEVLAVGGA